MGETTARATSIAQLEVVARPRTSVFRSTTLSVAFSAVPLAVALVWASLPLQLWAVVGTLFVGFAVLAAVVFARYRSAYAGVAPDRFHLRGVVVRHRTVDLSAIDRVVIATTFGATPDRTGRELIGVDADGGVLFRMRGTMWDEQAFQAVVQGLDVQVTELPRPIGVREFRRKYPDARFWFERRPALVIGLGVAAALTAAVLCAEALGVFRG